MPAANLNISIMTCFNIRNSSSEQKDIEKLNKIDFFLNLWHCIWMLCGIKMNTLHIAEVSKIDITYIKRIHKSKCSHLQHLTPLQSFSCCIPIITLSTFLCLFTLRWCLRTIYSSFPKEPKAKVQCDILEVTEAHLLFLEINSGVSVCTSLFLKAKVPLGSSQVSRLQQNRQQWVVHVLHSRLTSQAVGCGFVALHMSSA